MSELILFSGNGLVTFVTAKKQIKKQPLSSDLETNDPSMYKRLQYAKDILIQMISKKQAYNGSSNAKQTSATIDHLQSTKNIAVIKDL